MVFINILKEALFFNNSHEPIIGPCNLSEKNASFPSKPNTFKKEKDNKCGYRVISLCSGEASPLALGLFDLAFAGEALGGGAEAAIWTEPGRVNIEKPVCCSFWPPPVGNSAIGATQKGRRDSRGIPVLDQ